MLFRSGVGEPALEAMLHGVRGLQPIEGRHLGRLRRRERQEQRTGERAIQVRQRDQHEAAARPDVQHFAGQLRAPVAGGQRQFLVLVIEQGFAHGELSRFGNRLRDAVADEYTQSRIDTLKTERMKDPCLAGKKLIIIDERGNVLPCEILKVLAEKGETDAPELGNFSFGNLRAVDFDLSALLESERGRAIRKFIEDERCWCTFECAQINNFVLNPQAYLRTIVRAVTNSPVEP